MAEYIVPQFDDIVKGKYLWIIMQARTLHKQKSMALGRPSDDMRLGGVEDTFKFLAPEEITESFNHTWSTVDSKSGELAEKLTGFMSKTADVTGVISAARQQGESNAGVFRRAEKAVTDSSNYIPKTRIDAALVYTDSSRREYTFDFYLADIGDPSSNILAPARRLAALSCASKPTNEAGVGIFYPLVFSIKTQPAGWLNIQHAALQSVNINYRGPYRNGLPIYAQLTLNFVEIDPLYRERLSADKGTVTTVSTHELSNSDVLRQNSESVFGRQIGSALKR